MKCLSNSLGQIVPTLVAFTAGCAVIMAITAMPACTCLAGREAASTGGCSDWNTDRFFETASVKEVTACLKAGADLKARDRGGRTPLHLAAEFSGSPAVITALADAGADVGARAEDDNRTPLYAAAEYNPNPAIIAALLEGGADPSAQSGRYYETPLHKAAASNPNPAVIAALLKAGGDLNAQNKCRINMVAGPCLSFT